VRTHGPLDPILIPDNLELDTARLDQHLLANAATVRTLVDAAQPTHDDVIADLGAGTGTITRELITRRPGKIYAIEIDNRFGTYLRPLSRRYPFVEVVPGDILATRLSDATRVVANPPFRITEKLLGWLQRLPALISATMVMGRSFGIAATALPGSPHYTRLSLEVHARFTVDVIATLPASDFHPSTRSSASIVQLVPRRPARCLDAFVDTMLTTRGGMKVKDLLWHLRTTNTTPDDVESPGKIVHALRRTDVVKSIYQHRLQQLTAADLSQLMAELHRLADH
jgi:16S rRNA A1518/A1519 N6-dimethyltransferase RsmA/KsgA/DIM1 with predicted DNA glycosylase/AP lyase activity